MPLLLAENLLLDRQPNQQRAGGPGIALVPRRREPPTTAHGSAHGTSTVTPRTAGTPAFNASLSAVNRTACHATGTPTTVGHAAGITAAAGHAAGLDEFDELLAVGLL